MRELSTVVLASVSPRRLELLASLGLRVEVVRSGYEESEIAGYLPEMVAAAHARGKASDVLAKREIGIVIGADTVVDLDGQTLGKPKDRADAARMLRALSGRDHLVHTAVYVGDAATGAAFEHTSTARVRFYRLDDRAIAEYAAGPEVLDKAGAYGIQARGALLVERIEGDFYTVMGFPLAAFARALPQLGYRIAMKPAESSR